MIAQRNLHEPLPHGKPRPFKITLPAADIDELKYKLDHARWGPQDGLLSDDDPKVDAGLLPTPDMLRRLAKRWRNMDFAKLEKDCNRFESFVVDIDWCKPLHYVHKKSSRPDAIPLVIVHGWPSGFIEFFGVIEKLAEPENKSDPAFHVVVPSLPGCTFSKGPPSRKQGIGEVDGYSHLIDTLMMSVLGYTSYVTQGGDWGSAHCRTLGAKFARPDGKTGCRAVHLNFCPIVPPAGMVLAHVLGGTLGRVASMIPGQEGRNLAKMLNFQQNMAYYIIQQARPQQLGPAITDSPIGLLAWISFFYEHQIEKPSAANAEADDRAVECLLALCTLYFITKSAATSTLLYHNNRLLTDIHADPAYRIAKGATLGYSDFPRELINVSAFWLQKTGDLRFYCRAPSGGHFASIDVPDTYVNHLRVAFTPPLSTARGETAQSRFSLFGRAPPAPETSLMRMSKEEMLSRGIESCDVNGSLWTPALPTGGGTQ